MTPKELAEIEGRYTRTGSPKPLWQEVCVDVAALLSEVRRLTPAGKVARWEVGVDDYEGCTVLRDPATNAVLGWYNRHDWGGSIWHHDGFANHKSLTDLATKHGWEVRDGE